MRKLKNITECTKMANDASYKTGKADKNGLCSNFLRNNPTAYIYC